MPVTLNFPSSTPVTVHWTTLYVSGPPTRDGLQATPPDYIAVDGVVTFGPGQTAAQITIPVTSETTESAEYIYVSFHDPTGAKMGGNWGVGTGVIPDRP